MFCPQVNIQVPAPDLQSDVITITGLSTHLDRAKEGLLERVKELQAEQEDRVSRPAGSQPGGKLLYCVCVNTSLP